MSRKRKIHSTSFKAKVALAALREDKTSSQLTSEYGVTSGQISTWKKELIRSAPTLFEKGGGSRAQDPELIKAPLYEEIGRLKMELEWLKKKADLCRA
jgi:transposase-like protein